MLFFTVASVILCCLGRSRAMRPLSVDNRANKHKNTMLFHICLLRRIFLKIRFFKPLIVAISLFKWQICVKIFKLSILTLYTPALFGAELNESIYTATYICLLNLRLQPAALALGNRRKQQVLLCPHNEICLAAPRKHITSHLFNPNLMYRCSPRSKCACQ